jgi:hypothetical protein
VLAVLLPCLVLGQAPAVRAGVTGGVVRLTALRTEQVLTGILEYDPLEWFSVSLIPSWVRVSQKTSTGQSQSRSSVADLPLAAAFVYSVATGWAPSLGTGVTVSFPTGNAACGLGSGVTSVGVNAGIGVAPVEPLRLSVDASRSLSGQVVQSALTAPGSTWLSSEASLALSRRWNASFSFGADLGSSDPLRPPARELGGGLSYALSGPLELTLDGSRGLTTASPKWVLSIGLGTAFSGTSPVTPTAPLRRLQKTFAGGTTGTTSQTTSTCR